MLVHRHSSRHPRQSDVSRKADPVRVWRHDQRLSKEIEATNRSGVDSGCCTSRRSSARRAGWYVAMVRSRCGRYGSRVSRTRMPNRHVSTVGGRSNGAASLPRPNSIPQRLVPFPLIGVPFGCRTASARLRLGCGSVAPQDEGRDVLVVAVIGRAVLSSAILMSVVRIKPSIVPVLDPRRGCG